MNLTGQHLKGVKGTPAAVTVSQRIRLLRIKAFKCDNGGDGGARPPPPPDVRPELNVSTFQIQGKQVKATLRLFFVNAFFMRMVSKVPKVDPFNKI